MKKKSIDPIHVYLEGLPQANLAGLVKELIVRFPEILGFLADCTAIAAKDANSLIERSQLEIAALVSRDWYDDYDDEDDDSSDFDHIRELFNALLILGQADAVLILGRELLDAALKCVAMHQDDIIWRVAPCLTLVMDALSHTSLSPLERMLWVAEAETADEYGIMPDTKKFWAVKRPADTWSRFADGLAARLPPGPIEKDIKGYRQAHHYHRDRAVDFLLLVLDKAERRHEISPLCEREADITGSYVRLVKRLVAEENWPKAKAWIDRGIASLKDALPGITRALREIETAHWHIEGDWTKVAGIKANDFLREPSLKGYKALREAAKRAKAWRVVREAALRYLETGILPPAHAEENSPANQRWPLPPIEPPESDPHWPRRFPLVNVLIDLAIEEKRPDDVLRWYDAMKPGTQRHDLRDKVAEAVAAAQPDRAVAIWREMAEFRISLTQPASYEIAAQYLNKASRVWKEIGQETAWRDYLARLQEVHAKKKRLMEILGRLDGM